LPEFADADLNAPQAARFTFLAEVMNRIPVAVVGAGQAGLATSYWLTERGIDHVLFERGRPGDSWRHRWDSFCLVTPNRTLDLPGFPYDGDDPDGFIPRDEIAGYVERYRAFLDAPVIDSTIVERLTPIDAGWRVTTDRGAWEARCVVVATGTFPFPFVPPVADGIHTDVTQLHSQDYRRPSALPAGAVLVVGSGQSGAQIVDDLLIGGREVWFSIGRSGWAPRRFRGKDTTQWMRQAGFMDMPITDPAMRDRPSLTVSGRDGGKDLNLRALGNRGAHLVGRVTEADGAVIRFSNDVADTLDAADAVAEELLGFLNRYIDDNEIEAPPADTEVPDWAPRSTCTELDLDVAGITAVVWATGYRYDFSWIDADIFDERGYPRQERGVTSQPGLSFIGLHGMYTVGSGLFSGVGADAEYVVDRIGVSER